MPHRHKRAATNPSPGYCNKPHHPPVSSSVGASSAAGTSPSVASSLSALLLPSAELSVALVVSFAGVGGGKGGLGFFLLFSLLKACR